MTTAAPTTRWDHDVGQAAGSTSRSLRGAARGVSHVLRDVGSVLRERAAATATPAGLLGTATETLWLTAHAVTYPFGLLAGERATGHRGYRVEDLTPSQRGLLIADVEAAGTPILLLHGMIDNHSIFTLLRRGLRRRGFGQLHVMNYSIFTADVRVAAARLAHEVERVCAETGYERIHIVGHSLGGLIARYYVTRLGGDERVHTVVTLGTPHNGTYAAHLLPTSIGRQMRPGSPLLRELAQPVPSCATRFISYWSDLDEAIIPAQYAQLRHDDLNVTNVDLSGVGHLSLPILPAVVSGISTSLAMLDAEGHTVASGVTPLDTRRR
ncbi:esterase/lipase family protein [Janibacter sp. G56]|uniref:esterase/lipase family protein n=1 Tax=Janibacter sp. G56 TaxID=3418717 RepID=UPI003D03A099